MLIAVRKDNFSAAVQTRSVRSYCRAEQMTELRWICCGFTVYSSFYNKLSKQQFEGSTTNPQHQWRRQDLLREGAGVQQLLDD